MKLKKALKPPLPVFVRSGVLLLISAAVSAAAGISFILISGASVSMPVMVFSTAVLVLLPAFVTKTYSIISGFRSRRLLTPMIIIGCLISLHATLSYYISHDYELSVYRYMRVTDADIYYFGGYDKLADDYFDGADLMQQMQAAPAALVLEGMSDDRIAALTASQLKSINSRSLWDYLGFGEILGSDPDEVEASVRASRSMNAYEFTFGYRGLRAKTFGYIFTHPRMIGGELKLIAAGGAKTVNIPVLAAFLISQIFVLYVVGMHFDINGKGQLIYIYDPEKSRARREGMRDMLAGLRERLSKKQ